jgi:DNA-binding NarL/FixJ family response regulator
MEVFPVNLPVMKTARLVLVEDHAMVRDTFASRLRAEGGFTIAGEYGTVAEAIRGCLKAKPALVIVDWMLPDGRGIDVARKLATRKDGEPRFLVLSTAEKAAIVREALEAGVHGFVMKRWPYEVLREAIRRVLSGHTYYCPTSSELLVETLRSEAGAAVRPNAREKRILQGLARGESIKEIAHNLEVNHKTIYHQCSALKEKLGIHTTVGLVRYAVQHGLVEEI